VTRGAVLPEGYDMREIEAADAGPLAEAYRRNREHLEPWEPAREEEFFTERGQQAVIGASLTAIGQGQLVAWVLTHGEDIVGRMNLNNVVRGVLQSASLGYWVDVGHLGRGLASGAVELACVEARRRGLHRVEAGTLLHNQASQRVLERCGFEHYGTAPSYLFIAGAWQDHRLYQRVLHDRPL
jgi:ribosomal-protein-alanine N-acetyltransferase